MKTLNTIQTLSKIGKIISTIIFIFCIVGFCGSLIGIISLAVGMGTLQLGGITLKGVLENEAGLSESTMYASMAVAAVFCAGEAVLSKFAEHYFHRELQDGTPFTQGGAKELLRLGILAICIPVGAQVLAGIVHGILEHTMGEIAALEYGGLSSVPIGIMMIVLSLVCRYGAELNEGETRAETV